MQFCISSNRVQYDDAVCVLENFPAYIFCNMPNLTFGKPKGNLAHVSSGVGIKFFFPPTSLLFGPEFFVPSVYMYCEPLLHVYFQYVFCVLETSAESVFFLTVL